MIRRPHILLAAIAAIALLLPPTAAQAVTPTPAAASSITQTAKALKTLKAPTPKISGTSVVGATLTAKTGVWTGKTTMSFRWLADGKQITGATKSTFKIPKSVKDKRITVRVTGKKAGYKTANRQSAPTAHVMLAATLSISGKAAVGSTVTAKTGTWTGKLTVTYQWYANRSAISGAKGRTYRVPASLAGKTLTVKVTGKRSGYPTTSRTSHATPKVSRPVKAPAHPSRTVPVSGTWNCPSWAPVKGNQSGIYHVPGGAYYSRTNPEECFSTPSAAAAAGYRASKR